jgi:hypothetical protein
VSLQALAGKNRCPIVKHRVNPTRPAHNKSRNTAREAHRLAWEEFGRAFNGPADPDSLSDPLTGRGRFAAQGPVKKCRNRPERQNKYREARQHQKRGGF